MLMTILKYGAPSLREISQPVEKFDEDLEKLAADMFETMYAAPGIGLAAPQVGVNIRLIVIDIRDGDESAGRKLILCNPRITASEGTQEGDEGCLSVPDFMEHVKRPMKVAIEAQNIKGEPFELTGEGMLARAICHEIDHLDGVMFVDRVSPLKRALMRGKIRKLTKAGKW
ncbi:MAG: peptide deformylase [Acidobacteriota bacterium]|jgi:peptide deformylase|nr:peptide deformylase [Acidobacteriota bacterium]